MASRFCFFWSVASVGAPARWLALVATAVACGGVSEERVASLEANVAALKQASASDSGVDLKGRVDAVETSTAASIQKMEEIMEILQREVTALSAASGGGGNHPRPPRRRRDRGMTPEKTRPVGPR